MHNPAPPTAAGGRASSAVRLAAFFELTKPRIAVLLQITCIAAMVSAVGGLPKLSLLGATALGLYLTSGGASAINHVVDRDIDAQMERTCRRPVVEGTVSPLEGTVFGIGLMIAGTLVLGLSSAGWLAAGLSLGGGLFYAVGYTLLLKRYTVQNIVIGGAAGAVPPLVGWAAATGELAPIAWLLCAIVFLWTPPHFWSLALLVSDQYARVGVPMMPGVRGARHTSIQISIYTAALLGASVIGGVLAGLGWIYLVVATACGVVFLVRAERLRIAIGQLADPNMRGRISAPADRLARQAFLFSMLYLALVFVAVVVDRLLV